MGRVGNNRRGLPHRRFLKEWREHRGLNQTQLAERIGDLIQNERIDHSRISKIERGVESITEQMLFAWADALQVEPGALFVRPDIYFQRARAMELLDRHSPEQVATILDAVERLRRAG